MAYSILLVATLVSSVLAGPSLKMTNVPLSNASARGAASSLTFLGSRMKAVDHPLSDENAADLESRPKSIEETAKEMEETVTNLLLGKSAFGATPMGDSVTKIIDIVKNTMEPKVLEASESDQKNLKNLADEIATCGSEKDASLQVAKVSLVKYEKESALHKSCRGQEATMYTSKEGCIAQQKSLRQVKELKCKAFASFSNEWGHSKHNSEIVKKAGSESVEAYVTRISVTFCGKHVHGKKGKVSRRGGWGGGLDNGVLDRYLQSKDACARATKAWSSKVKQCKREITEYNTQKSKCNQFQTFMDGAACKRAVLAKDACESYAGCYYNKKKSYTIVEGKVHFDEIDRKAEWRGLKRIGCLIDAFADGRVTNDEINVCRNGTHSTALLDIDYPAIPPLDKCFVPHTYPATELYKKKEFAPLPAVAKGKSSVECSGMEEISVVPRDGSPKSCKCERVTMNGYYSAGPLVKCTGCLDVRKSTQVNSCPVGTKIFSPASKGDWKTFIDSAEPLKDPSFIVDVTRPQNGCAGCSRHPMNSDERKQKSWRTSDGSPWWLRSSRYGNPSGDYKANCYLGLRSPLTNENHVTFNDYNCRYHSKSYYCQLAKQSLTPAKGSPNTCKCTNVVLAGSYSAGSLVKCEHCLDIRRSTDKNSCPAGMKLFAPRSKSDWKTFFKSAAPLKNPAWIIDITRPADGCGGCKGSAMKSSNHRQATWRTSDGAPWWLRDTKYHQPDGDYKANCYMALDSPRPLTSTDENDIVFDGGDCGYHSASYYCQPVMEPVEKLAVKLHERAEEKANEVSIVSELPMQQGLLEYTYYFPQNGRMVSNDRRADAVRSIAMSSGAVNYPDAGESTNWPGFSQGTQYAVKWDGILFITDGGKYTFKLGSDDGSVMYMDKKLVINNGGYHRWEEKSFSKDLNPLQHKITVKYFQGSGSHGCVLLYTGPDTGDEEKPVPSDAVKFENPSGFLEEVFYRGRKSSVAEAVSGEPRQTRIVRQIAMGSTRRTWPGFLEKDGFGCRWTGTLSIVRGGRYRFWIQSDDGSKLYVDGQLVVNNDGPHGMRSRYADRDFSSKSEVDIKMEYFERSGGAGVFLKYMGPDTGNKLRTMGGRRVKAPFVHDEDLVNKAPCDYSEAACQKVAEAQGLELGGHGSDFAGDYTTKGCYTYSEGKYAGYAYYGRVKGGDVSDEDELGTLKSGQARINTCEQADYAHLPKGCVEGHNIVTYKGKTIDECKAICDSKASCKAFEFGVAYGGSGKYKPGDCLPQSSADQAGCDGAKYNLDLYIKEPYNDIKGIPTDLVDKVPDVSMVVSSVNYEESRHPWNGFDQAVNFAARFTGAIAVKTGGEYKLFLGCDDGCKLFMGATYDIGIDNGGLHTYLEKWHKTELIEGEHKIMITYVQKDGVSELKFSWQGADTGNEKTIVGDMGGAGVFRRLAGPADMPMLSLLSHKTTKNKPLGKANATKPFQFLSREDKADYLSRDDNAKEAPAKKPQASFLARAENTLISGVLSMLR